MISAADRHGMSRLSGRGHQRRQAQWLLLQAGDVTLHLAAAKRQLDDFFRTEDSWKII